MKEKFFTAKNTALLGILVALVVVLQIFASSIPMFGVTLNFGLIPIALGAILLGAYGGAIVGFTNGLVAFIVTAVMGGEVSTAYLFQTNPVILTVMCIGKTTIAGFISGLVFSLLSKNASEKKLSVLSVVCSFIIPVVNTGIYMLGMILMKGSVAEFLNLASSSANFVFVSVFMIIWLNFVLEIVITIIFSPVIGKVIKIVRK